MPSSQDRPNSNFWISWQTQPKFPTNPEIPVKTGRLGKTNEKALNFPIMAKVPVREAPIVRLPAFYRATGGGRRETTDMKSRQRTFAMHPCHRHALIIFALAWMVFPQNVSAQSASSQASSRAQQALLHTSVSRKSRPATQQIPAGYRVRHETLASNNTPFDESAGDAIYYDDAAGSAAEQPFEQWQDGWGGSDEYAEWDGYDSECDAGCECPSCNGYCGPFGGFFGSLISLENTSLFAGTQGFTGPMNLEGQGSFGFHEGINYGAPLPFFPGSGIGFQVGNRWVQSNLSGTGFSRRQRNQTFTTIGAFRRASYGWEGGVVADILRDRWYGQVDMTQVRGQISYKFPQVHEWGYWFTASDSNDSVTSPIDQSSLRFEITSLHSFFYRRRMTLVPGGELTLFAGASGDKDGLVGTKVFLPVTNSLAFQSDFTYLTPQESTPNGGTANEGWNLGLSLVWRLGMNAQCCEPSCFQPLFDVAGNGTMMLNQDGAP